MCNQSNCNQKQLLNIVKEEGIVVYINKFVGKEKRNYGETFGGLLIECECCKTEDIDNEYNFKNICYSCCSKLCIKCFDELENGGNEDGEELMDYFSNGYEVESEWICIECSSYCQMCEMDKDGDCFCCLIDREGDEEHFCCFCVNEYRLDIEFEGIYYNELLCRIKDTEFNIFGEIEEGDNELSICCFVCEEYNKYNEKTTYYIDNKKVCESCCNSNVHHINC